MCGKVPRGTSIGPYLPQLWRDNRPDARGMGALWMRLHFNDVITEYCTAYERAHGRLPVGAHRLERLGNRVVHFRWARLVARSSSARSNIV